MGASPSGQSHSLTPMPGLLPAANAMFAEHPLRAQPFSAPPSRRHMDAEETKDEGRLPRTRVWGSAKRGGLCLLPLPSGRWSGEVRRREALSSVASPPTPFWKVLILTP